MLIDSITRDLEKKFTQLVQKHEDVKWTPKKLPALPCIAMQKFDGVCALALVVDGDAKLYSRTGKPLTNVRNLELIFHGHRITGVFCVEVCHHVLSLEQISGIVNPNRVEPIDLDFSGAYLGAYDFIELDSFIDGKDCTPFSKRLSKLEDITDSHFLSLYIPDYVYCETEEEVTTFHNQMLSLEEEGTVRCQPQADWVAGRRSCAKTKIVREYDVDLEIASIVEGKGKRAGTMGKVLVYWRKYGLKSNPRITHPVDVCMTDEERLYYYNNPKELVGKIHRVHALQVGSKGSMRLAKLKEERHDKLVADL